MDLRQLSSKVDCEIFIKIGNPSTINVPSHTTVERNTTTLNSLNLANKRSERLSLSSSDQFYDNRETFLRMSKWVKESKRKGCQFLIKIPEFLAFPRFIQFLFSKQLFPSLRCISHLAQVFTLAFPLKCGPFCNSSYPFVFFRMEKEKNCEYRYHNRSPDAVIK